MLTLCVTCPHCSFSRNVPADQLPEQPVQATCPKCGRQFTFSKADALSATTPAAPAPVPAPSAGLPQPLPSATHSSQEQTRSPDRGGESPASSELMSISDLFSSTWEQFKQRWLLLIGIVIATVVAAAAPPMLVALLLGGTAKASFSGMVSMFMLFGLAIIGSLVVVCWGMAAAVSAAVDARLGFKEAFEKAKGCWIALAWVSALYSFIVGGASLLLLIPGILTGIWFFACAYLVVEEDTRGMDALLKSKALVDGRFWPVTGRLFLVWLLGMVLGMIPAVGPFLSLAMAPFSMLYSVQLYRNLKETAGTVSWSSTDGTKAAWLLLGLAGYVLIPLLLFLLLGAAFFSSMEPLFKMLIQQGEAQQVIGADPAILMQLFRP